jgi:hypothetical protein
MQTAERASTKIGKLGRDAHQNRATACPVNGKNQRMNFMDLKLDLKRVCNRTVRRVSFAAALSSGIFLTGVGEATADVTLPQFTVGAGMQTSLFSCSTGCVYSDGVPHTPDGSVQGFQLDTVRLYLNGTVTDNIKMTFNTEYDGATNRIEVLDAIGRFEFSDQVNIWAGRLLPPSDRANLYGPYYANDWAPYADGVADYYPQYYTGRDNGVAYWGQFGILKVQVGVFDGRDINSAINTTAAADAAALNATLVAAGKAPLPLPPPPGKMIYAARLHLDFWDPEPGYYYNSTYYGEKDLLAVGVAAQSQDSKTAWSLDGLLEKKLPNLGAVTVEAEFQKDNGLNIPATNHGWYVLPAYLFPQVIGIGKVQVLGKYSQKTTDAFAAAPADKLKTAEFNLNYIIKSFNARTGLYYLNQKDDVLDTTKKEVGLKLQLQF